MTTTLEHASTRLLVSKYIYSLPDICIPDTFDRQWCPHLLLPQLL